MGREDVSVGPHVVAERRLGGVADRGGDRRRHRVGPRLHVAAEHGVFLAQLVVEPRADAVAVVVGLRRRDVAVDRGAGGRRGIGFRHELVEQRARHRADAIGRDDVAGRGARQRIGSPRCREIAEPLRVRQDQDVGRVAAGVAVALVVAEPKNRFFTIGPPRLPPNWFCFSFGGQREEVARLERVVAVELPGAPCLVRPALRDDADDRAGVRRTPRCRSAPGS